MLVKALGKLELLCMAGSCFALAAIMLLITADVAVRKVTDVSIPGVFEITEDYLMVAIVFLAVSYVYRIGGHVRVTLFVRHVPRGTRFYLELFNNLAALVFFLLIAVMGWQSAMSALAFGEVSSGAVVYPIAPALFLVPAGAGLTCLRILQTILEHLLENRP
jgi:TRAP-type C4-dicarboxylate transport system permease small subunit